MKRINTVIILWSISYSLSANCDLTHFNSTCNILLHNNPTFYAPSLIYCGSSYGYITKAQFDQISRYYRRDINNVLKINDAYIESPCIPARRE